MMKTAAAAAASAIMMPMRIAGAVCFFCAAAGWGSASDGTVVSGSVRENAVSASEDVSSAERGCVCDTASPVVSAAAVVAGTDTVERADAVFTGNDDDCGTVVVFASADVAARAVCAVVSAGVEVVCAAVAAEAEDVGCALLFAVAAAFAVVVTAIAVVTAGVPEAKE